MRKIYFYVIFLILFISCYTNKNITISPIVQEELQIINNIEIVEYDSISLIKEDSIILTETYIEEIKHTPYIKNNIEKGTLIYQIDSFFIINTTTRVEAKIIKEKYDTIPKYIIETFSKNKSGKIKKYIIPVGNIMNMELISLDEKAFNINKISSDNQEVSDNVIAEWIWGVTPLK
jgi:N12 class adenine-specific DNA methylase